MPNPAIDYNIVFDLNSTADKIANVTSGFTTVAVIVNTFAQWKVGKDHRPFIVFHGPTADLAVNDDAYRQRHDGQRNPNVRMTRELSDARVQSMVCGQLALQNNIDLKTLRPDVQLNYSTPVTLMNLRMQGYARFEE